MRSGLRPWRLWRSGRFWRCGAQSGTVHVSFTHPIPAAVQKNNPGEQRRPLNIPSIWIRAIKQEAFSARTLMILILRVLIQIPDQNDPSCRPGSDPASEAVSPRSTWEANDPVAGALLETLAPHFCSLIAPVVALLLKCRQASFSSRRMRNFSQY